MAIPTQFPVFALPVRPAALQALILQAGQVVEAKVLGTSANGISQVQIGKQVLNLTLPTLMAAGTTMNLQAQGSGAEQKLVLLPMPASEPAPSAALQSSPSSTGSSPTPVPQAGPNPSIAAEPATTPLPTPPGALRPLGLQAGQVVTARVLGPAPNGATQIQIGPQTVEVTLPAPAPAGTVLPLRVVGAGPQQQLVLVSPPAAGTAPAAPTDMAAASVQRSAPPVAQAASPVPAATPPLLPSGPEAALTQMVQAAVQQQDSIGNLTKVLAEVVGKVPLPQPVLQAAQQVLAASLPLSAGIDGAAMQRAIAASGIFQEAVLAQGAPQLAKGDLKTTLLVLRNTLVTWLGQSATVAPAPGPLPPPVRGASPRARPTGAGPPDIPEEPIEAGKVMLSRTEGSLARLRLHQHASLPESTAPGAPADWSTDLPVLIGTYQTVMQLRIQREPSAPDQPVAERGWQIHFAMDLPSLGEVGAQVGLRGGITSVRLWASDLETATRLEVAAPELSRSLADAGLHPGFVMVRANEPAPVPISSGHFVDKRQ